MTINRYLVARNSIMLCSKSFGCDKIFQYIKSLLTRKFVAVFKQSSNGLPLTISTSTNKKRKEKYF